MYGNIQNRIIQSFQFYKVRLKHFMALPLKERAIFQFYKVRLKPPAAFTMAPTDVISILQSPIKAGFATPAVSFFQDFNSTKSD